MSADLIEVTGLTAVGICGVLPEERERAQPFRLDLTVEVDLEAAGLSDDLADTVDYGSLAHLAALIVETTSYQLVEALADAICRALLEADQHIEAATVTVTKLRPPLALQLEGVGVTRTRHR